MYLKPEKELLQDANLAIFAMNTKFNGKKITGALIIHNFILKNDKENIVVELKHQNDMTFYPMDVDFQEMSIIALHNRGLHLDIYLKWDPILNCLYDKLTNHEEMQNNLISIVNGIDSYQLIHSNEKIEIYCSYLYIKNIGAVIIFYDNITNYFEDTSLSTYMEKDGKIEEISQIVTKQDGLDLLLKLQNNNTQYLNHYISESNSYDSIAQQLKSEKMVISNTEIKNLFSKPESNNQILQLLLFNKIT